MIPQPASSTRTDLLWALGALSLGALFLLAGSSQTAPHPGAPLDDTFIHLQYARLFGDFEFYRYQHDAPASSGATSLLYLHLLGFAAMLGAGSDLLLRVALGIGLVSWAAVAVLTYRLAASLTDRTHANWTTAAVVTSGPLLWSAASGMEITLVTALLLWALLTYEYRFIRSLSSGDGWFVTAISLLALSRPEGGYAAGILWGLAFVHKRYGENRARHSLSWVFAIPPLAMLWPYLITLLTTGQLSSNGLVAKSEFHNPDHVTLVQAMAASFWNGLDLLGFLNGRSALQSGWLDFTPPGLLAVACAAGLLLGIRRWGSPLRPAVARGLRNPGTIAAMLTAIAVWSTAVATLTYWSLHHYRYLLPLIPTLLILAAFTLHRLEGAWRETSWIPARGRSITALGLLLVLLQVSSLPRWATRLAEESGSIRHKQGVLAAWLRNNTEETETIGINDAGLLAYENERHIFDIVGLMEAPEVARIYRMGNGALYEAFTSKEGIERPDIFVVFPSWFEELEAFDVLGQPVLEVPDPYYDEMEKIVYRPSWSSVGRGEKPRASAMPYAGWNVVDELDVFDLASERAHDYRSLPEPGAALEDPTLFRRNFGYHEEIESQYPLLSDEAIIERLKENGRLADVDILDAGRRHTGRERFTVHNIDPSAPLAILMRTCDDRDDRQTFHYVVRVTIDGDPVGDWDLEGTPWNWYERSFTIPADRLEGSSACIELQAIPNSESPWYVSTMYWFLQPGAEANGV